MHGKSIEHLCLIVVPKVVPHVGEIKYAKTLKKKIALTNEMSLQAVRTQRDPGK